MSILHTVLPIHHVRQAKEELLVAALLQQQLKLSSAGVQSTGIREVADKTQLDGRTQLVYRFAGKPGDRSNIGVNVQPELPRSPSLPTKVAP